MQFLFASATEAAQEAAEGASPGLFEALGINVQMLIQQSIAFLILVFILAKFVYPHLLKAIDNRREAIEEGLKEAQESQKALEEAEARVSDMLKDARKEADEVIKRSQKEAATLVADAETKAKQRAERLVADARTQLEADVNAARQALKAETIKLVAGATEKIIGEKLDTSKDAALIARSLEGQK